MNVNRSWIAVFQSEFREDLRYWVETNPRTALRAFSIIEDVLRGAIYRNWQARAIKTFGQRRMVTPPHGRTQNCIFGISRPNRFSSSTLSLLIIYKINLQMRLSSECS